MRVHVRVITPITTRGFRKLDDLKALESAELEVSHSDIDTGPGSIESEYEEALSVPGTLAKIVEAERAGAHAVVIDCMGDPGLKPGREIVTIPVLGPAETGIHLAAMLGHKFSVLTVLKRLVVQFENQARLYGVHDKFASVRSVDIPVLELEKDIAATQAALVEEAVLAIEEDGAQSLIFGCTGMLGCAGAVRRGLLARGYDVPVIDPVPTAISIAAALVRVALSHSKLTYPPPPVKAVVGYDIRVPAHDAPGLTKAAE